MEDFELDTNLDIEQKTELKPVPKGSRKKTEEAPVEGPVKAEEIVEPISCLRNEKVIVRYVPRQSGIITNPKHIFYGGMGESAKRTFTVPILYSSKTYINVLTNEEKLFLEKYMGLEYNDLSIYKNNNNFWSDYRVTLTKGDTILDLSNPDDYIKYKVLLANKDYIAPSMERMQDVFKATYQFVLIRENEESQASMRQLSYNQRAYMKFGEFQNDEHTLKLIIETLDGRPIADKTKLEFLQAQAGELILADAKMFCKVAEDPYLATKVLIRRAHNAGLLAKRGNYYYVKADNTPLCENNEEPTLSSAARYLNAPKHQELKLSLEAKLE